MNDKKRDKVADNKKTKNEKETEPLMTKGMVRFEVYGQEMIEKTVKLSGNSGRVYLPPDWVGHNVKIVKID